MIPVLILTITGAKFTPNSEVRWNGAARPTTFVSNSQLTAAISATDVSTVGDISVTVYDPEPPPDGTETAPLTFRVVESIFRIYLPVVLKGE